jgi:hypothetical protein
MKTILSWAGVIATAIVVPVAAQQAFTGRLSDSTCGASHQAKAAGGTTASGAEG